MAVTKKRQASRRQAEANRRNSGKSTGPRTPEGKQRVALNALKHGLGARQSFYRTLLAVGEDPRDYRLLLNDLEVSLAPANPHQRMLVDNLAELQWERRRLRRARTGLVAEKMRHLERQRDYRLLEFDCAAPDLPQAEVLKKGLDRIPDSPAKFEKMLAALGVLIEVAKEDNFSFDPEPELNLLYGEEPSLEGAYLRNTFRRFVKAAQSSAGLQAGTRAGLKATGEPDLLLRPSQMPKSNSLNPEQAPSEPERLLLLKELFGAKQRVLRRYQLYNRQFIQITPEQRSACFAASEPADLQLTRQEALNDRQLRLALRLYWQTQKEDAACAAQAAPASAVTANPASGVVPTGPESGPQGRVGDNSSIPNPESRIPNPEDRLLAELEEIERWLGTEVGAHRDEPGTGVDGDEPRVGTPGYAPEAPDPGQTPIENPGAAGDPAVLPNPFGDKQSHQVIENTAGVSGIGQNKANFGAGPSTVDAARPKVQELLEQMQSDPAARAMVETFLLQQMVAEESRREEVEVATLQREKEKRTALEDELEQMVAAQQALERKNRRLRAEAATSEVAHQQFREQIRPAEAAVPERHEPTREEIFCKISEVIGVGQPPSYRVESEVEGMPGYHLTQQEYWDFQHGCGPAWEEEQRRKAAGAARQQAQAPEEELYPPH